MGGQEERRRYGVLGNLTHNTYERKIGIKSSPVD